MEYPWDRDFMYKVNKDVSYEHRVALGQNSSFQRIGNKVLLCFQSGNLVDLLVETWLLIGKLFN